MNEKENMVSEKNLKKDGDIVLFEGKPFTGTSIGFTTDADEKKSKDEKGINFKFTTYKHGRKISLKHWEDSRDNGPQIQWYESGSKKSEVNIENDKRQGLMSGWYESGKKEYEYLLMDDKLDGLQVEWYENGEKKHEQFWKEGNAYGLCIDYHENGNKKGEGYFVNGKKHGLFINWDENGEKLGEEYFEDGIERSIESNDDNEGLSFSEALLKLSSQLGKEAGCSSKEIPETVEQAAILVLTTLCYKVILEAGHFISPDSLDKAITEQCFISACTYSIYVQLKKSNPEIKLIDLTGKVGGTLFMLFEQKEKTRIVFEGFKMFQELMANLEKHDELKSWLKSTYDGVLLYVTSGNGLTYDDKIITDVLKPLYLKLWESSESWN